MIIHSISEMPSPTWLWLVPGPARRDHGRDRDGGRARLDDRRQSLVLINLVRCALIDLKGWSKGWRCPHRYVGVCRSL
jgi:hypothetical protein